MRNEIHTSSLEEFVNSDKTVTDLTVDGKCSNCGGCCSNRLPLTDSEVRNLISTVKRKGLRPIFHGANLLLATPTIDMVCPFRHPEIGCVIYDQRPWICRQFQCNQDDSLVTEKIKDKIISGSKDFRTMSVRFVRETVFAR